MNYQDKFLNTQSVDKTFSFKDKIFSEHVAKYPKILYPVRKYPAAYRRVIPNLTNAEPNAPCDFSNGIYPPDYASSELNTDNFYPENKKNIFSLRIDVDELEEKNFLQYIKILEPFKKYVTLFCCAAAFRRKEYLLKELKSANFDVQSHGFYHHVYNDYENNYSNILKAKDFFDKAGINTIGFAAPMGKYNESLMLALEALGYIYSSDFSFDYLNFPHYPKLKKRFSKILQVPIFPICPELLFAAGFNLGEVMAYYDKVLESLADTTIPVIIYNHTDIRYSQVKDFLKQFLSKISRSDKLYKCNTSDFALWCLRQEDRRFSGATGILNKKITAGFLKIPDSSLLGQPGKIRPSKMIKKAIKNAIDFETVTPDSEIKGSRIKKEIKLFIRKIKGENL